MIPTIDKHIIEQYQGGDSLAFKTIYDLTSPFIYNVILGIVKHPENAADLTHDVFIKLYNARNTFNGSVKITTWIYRIAINHALNSVKRHQIYLKKAKQFLLQTPQTTYITEEDEFTETHTVREILSQLPETFRVILILREYRDLSYDDIAIILDCEIGTVKSRLYRAKKAFKTRYLNYKEATI